MHIDRYEFGTLVGDAHEIHTDVLVTPGGVREHSWRREGHQLQLEDLGVLLDGRPGRLVVGTGAYGRMRPAPDARGHAGAQPPGDLGQAARRRVVR